MEMNAAKVTKHKIFGGKPSFFVKKKKRKEKDEKSSFGDLPTEEIQEIVDNAVPVTKKGTKFGMRLFNGRYCVKLPLKVAKFQIRPSRFYAFMSIT